MRTVCVKEWVSEQYQATRTVYKTECHQEAYTAYRCETVPETRTRNVTTCRTVQEVQTIMKTVCENVPCVEERTVMKAHWTCKPVTKTHTKCVDHGHYECREVPCGPSCMDRMKKMCHHKKDCCCEEECCAPKTKTVRCWVPCPVVETYTTCHMERTCEYVPEVCHVTTYKTVTKQVPCQITVCKKVPETHTETYTVCTTRSVPYQATRTVSVCVPHQETYTACRMVCHTVEKQVPCETTCETSCCKTCGHKKHGSGLWHRSESCCD